MNILKSFGKNLLIVLVMLAFIGLNPFAVVKAQTYNPEARVSITFDDGFDSTYTNALPILSSRNLPATVYVTSGYIDSGITDDGFPSMSWADVVSLQNDYGWEIGAHTVSHPELPLLTAAQIMDQFTTSNSAYAAHGLNVTNLATPFGAYDNVVLTEALKYYYTHRGFADINFNTFPYNRSVLQVQSVTSVTTPAQVKAWVETAILNRQWLILVYHDIQPALNPNYEYTTTISDFTEMADVIKSSGVSVSSVRQAAIIPGANVLTNSGFELGLATGWTTDQASQITVDSANHGNYPSPNNSIKTTGSSTSNHLFSTLIDAVPGAQYLVQSFVNTTGLTSGEFGFYMDEYDSNNNWISGQWLGLVANNTVGFFSKVYNATSDLVARLRVQTYLTANSVGSVYADNLDLHNLSASPTPSGSPDPSASPSGSPIPSASPIPTGNNLIANPSFESGLANGWTTDNVSLVTLDSNNHGSSPSAQESIAMAGSSASSHLFYGMVPVDFNASYLFSAVVDGSGITSGELGFYMDEYDLAGNWISGQWFGSVANGVVTNFSRAYKASSNLVKQIRVQTYIHTGTVGTGYVDNYELYNLAAPSVSPSASPSGSPLPSTSPSVSPSSSPSASPSASPSPSVSPSPSPVGTNLVANNSFETLLAGFAANWTKDSENFIVDITSQGNDGTNSIKLTPNTVYSHLFSDRINIVDTTRTYIWKQNLKSTGTGEFGFYIDEYDAAGNWISGQWKGAIYAAFNGDAQFSYLPTSALVKSIRLQYYATPGSLFNLIMDSVSLI